MNQVKSLKRAAALAQEVAALISEVRAASTLPQYDELNSVVYEFTHTEQGDAVDLTRALASGLEASATQLEELNQEGHNNEV